MDDGVILNQAIALIERTRIEMEAKGYPPRVVAAAVDRARGTAYSRTMGIRDGIRDEAFYDVLVLELQRVEAWIVKERKNGQVTDILEQERG